MPTTQVDVYNRALAYLGQISGQQVEDAAEDSADADVLNRFYPQSLDAFLEEAWWSWATKYATLALDSSTAPEYWLYAYVYPADCVSPRYIVGAAPEDRIEFIEGTSEGGVAVIWSDWKSAELQYTARIEDFNRWSAAAVDAFAMKLAMDASSAYTGSIDKAGALEAKYERLLERAILASENRKQEREEDHNELIEARHGTNPSAFARSRFSNDT